MKDPGTLERHQLIEIIREIQDAMFYSVSRRYSADHRVAGGSLHRAVLKSLSSRGLCPAGNDEPRELGPSPEIVAIVEVSGGCVTEVSGDATRVIIVDYDNLAEGDTLDADDLAICEKYGVEVPDHDEQPEPDGDCC